ERLDNGHHNFHLVSHPLFVLGTEPTLLAAGRSVTATADIHSKGVPVFHLAYKLLKYKTYMKDV
ncbi:hypothetical protein, partial [Rhizobium oryzihabitans]|uniref:hypothetical protein n=1 Tax=Rhizobium oryzihabitans TaxID=2267833 RepID=UPI0040355FB9